MAQIRRRIPIHNILLQALVLFAFLGLAISGCDEKGKAIPEPDFSGTWVGSTIPDEPNKVPAVVTFKKQPDGKYTLDCGTPLDFTLTAEGPKPKDGTLKLNITGDTGQGHGLWRGTIILTMREDKKHMDVRIRNNDGATWGDKIELEKRD